MYSGPDDRPEQDLRGTGKRSTVKRSLAKDGGQWRGKEAGRGGNASFKDETTIYYLSWNPLLEDSFNQLSKSENIFSVSIDRYMHSRWRPSHVQHSTDSEFGASCREVALVRVTY
jgi:hypothetical protein